MLQRTAGDAGSYELLQDQLRRERERLQVLRHRYSDDHPDIKNSRAAIAEIQSELAALNPGGSAQVEVADNPAYVLINTQLQSTDLEIKNLLQKQNELRATIADHEALIKQAPHVEMQYEALLRRYENAGTKYRDLQAKLRAADVAANVENQMTGQRFTILEPPLLPLNPDSPNRRAIVILGLILALGIGAVCVVLAEVIDGSIRTVKKLTEISGSPPLAVIPYLENSADIIHARTQRNLIITAFFAGTALYIVYAII